MSDFIGLLHVQNNPETVLNLPQALFGFKIGSDGVVDGIPPPFSGCLVGGRHLNGRRCAWLGRGRLLDSHYDCGGDLFGLHRLNPRILRAEKMSAMLSPKAYISALTDSTQ